MKKRVKPFLYVSVCATMMIMPGGCVHDLPGDFCTLYEPVYADPHDTAPTLEQVDRNNALWLSFCTQE